MLGMSRDDGTKMEGGGDLVTITLNGTMNSGMTYKGIVYKTCNAQHVSSCVPQIYRLHTPLLMYSLAWSAGM